MNIQWVRDQLGVDGEICLKGLNLLAHAQWIEFDLGSQCGGHGKCGKDKVRLLPDAQKLVNPPTAIEVHQLSPEEIERGVRLACQCFPNESGKGFKVQV